MPRSRTARARSCWSVRRSMPAATRRAAHDFARSLETVAALPGLERLTFITSHPKDFTEKLARTMAQAAAAQSALAPSGAVRQRIAMLRRMNRKYTRRAVSREGRTLSRYCPGWAITTDIIVGFPGESDDDFARRSNCASGRASRRPIHVHLFAAARHAGGACGSKSIPPSRARRLTRLMRRVRMRRARLSRPQDRARSCAPLIARPVEKRPREACRQNARQRDRHRSAWPT